MRKYYAKNKLESSDSNGLLKFKDVIEQYHFPILVALLFFSSIISWLYFSSVGLHLTYNDAMSHLDISRRVFDNITPGLTQMGSVWLPLPHLMMLPTIWIDYFWRTGLSAGLVSMASYILTALITYKILRLVGGNIFIGIAGAGIIAINPNFFYLQTTALTEPLFIVLFSASMYYLLFWAKTEKSIYLIAAAFFIFLSTLTRYDGWFYLILASSAIFLSTYINKGWQEAKGRLILFATLAGFGVFLWLLYNQLIFGDALYFALSEFSAGSQQSQMADAGALPTKGNLFFSIKTYYYAVVSNIGFFTVLFAALGWVYFIFRNKNKYIRILCIVFLAPILFNILSLFLGQSVIYLPETVGSSWFNVRYGLIVLPVVAVFAAYLLKIGGMTYRIIILITIVIQSFSFVYNDYVITIIDGVLGASHKNVKGLGEEIGNIASSDDGLILASAASHDAILFSTKIPMKRFIHEGTGDVWDKSLKDPKTQAEYIIMRTNDKTDSVANAMIQVPNFQQVYTLRYDGDFADFYQRTVDFEALRVTDSTDNSITWDLTCIDTMKNSRDLARESLDNPNLQKEVSTYILAIKNTKANCVSVGTPYDSEFYPVLKIWADEAHKEGLRVWFRGNWSGWEGWFNYPKNMTRDEHMESTTKFISTNQELFKDGDIFTACPECEYGGPGNPLDTGDIAGFRSFMINENNQMQAVFNKNQKNVKTNFTSLNTDVAKRILDKDTVEKMGNIIVLDHYANSVEGYKNTLSYFNEKFPKAKIFLGEFGAPIPDIHGEMSDEEQAEFINSVINFLQTRSEVIGINYWVGSGGTTAIFSDSLEPKPGASALSTKFIVGSLKGSVKDKNNNPVSNIQMNVAGYDKLIKTNEKGEFILSANPGEYLIEVPESEKYEKTSKKVKITTYQSNNTEIILAEKQESWIEKIRFF